MLVYRSPVYLELNLTKNYGGMLLSGHLQNRDTLMREGALY